MKAIETAEKGQMVAANSLAWKGTVLMVGMISLLVLLSGCYTVVATYAPERLVDRFEYVEYADQQQALFYEEPQGVGVQIPAADFDTGAGGVGVRYRQDYGYDPYGYSPWVRRLYVDTYYNIHHRYRYRPNRMAGGWSVGMWWGGFSHGYGYYDTCWYDPFYWDLWWNDPFCYYDASYRSYWYPWRWGYVHSGWYWPCHYDYYYGYDPFYHDPYWGSYWYNDYYWYGGRGTGVIVSRDLERRKYDRRRGLADARIARDGTGASRDAAGGARDRTAGGDNPLTDSRRRSDRYITLTDGGRTTSRSDPRTRTDNSGSNVGQTKIRSVPPAAPGVVQGVKPLQGKPAPTTGPASAKNRNERTSSGSSTSRTIFRTLGQILGRASGTSSRSRNSGTSTGSSSRNRATSSSPPRTTTTTRPRTSRPPPQTTASNNWTSTGTTSRTTVMQTRTTRSNPGANTSRPTTTSRTYTPPRTTTSRPTTSSRPPRTSSPPRTTTSRPPPRTISRPRTTTSRPPPRSSSGSRPTSSRPPRTTTSRPPPEVVTSASGLTYHSYVSTPINNYGMSNRSYATGARSGEATSYTGTSSSYSQSNSYSGGSSYSGSMGSSSSSSSMSSGSRSMSSGMSRTGSRTSSSVAGSRSRRPPQ